MRSPRIITGVVVGALLGSGLTGRAVAQGTWRVSVPTPGGRGTNGSRGGQGDDYSLNPAISSDGRFVAFESKATNLVRGDTNGYRDIFVHDRQTGHTTRVSVDSAGAQGTQHSYWASISADGRFVAFESGAGLVAGDTNGQRDIFVHDRQTAVTTRASVRSNGHQGNDDSFQPWISADGNFVTLSSGASNLVAGDTNGTYDAFVHDRQTGKTTRVSVDSAGAEGNGSSIAGSLSGDGRFAAFQSSATNLVAGDTNGSSDVFVHDRQTGITTRVSVDSAGVEGNGTSNGATISADGRIVAFQGFATNLDGVDTNGRIDVFVHDRDLATTTRMSVDAAGVEGDGLSDGASISADGRFVAFGSSATNLVPADTNLMPDIFVRDRRLNTIVRVSVDSAAAEGDYKSSGGAISADGRFVAFWSGASNLVAGDTNQEDDVFVHGPWLTLSAESESIAAGEELSLATWIGEPGGVAVLKIVEVNGTPVSVPFASGLFGAMGLWSVDGNVPFGLAGIVVTFRAVGITPIGTLEATNRETVTFQ